MEMKAECTCEESNYCHEEEVGPWCNGCKYFEVTFLKAQAEPVAEVPCSAGLCAELSLMLDVFNSCIETKTLPKTGSPCQEKIIELLKRCGKEPTALKVRGA